MCERCDYERMMEDSGLEATTNRMKIMDVIGSNRFPLTAAEIYTTLTRSHRINRVTVYRILDLLVERNLVERLRTGDRAAHFGLAPNENHAPHPHFFCTDCGQIDCLSPDLMPIDTEGLRSRYPGSIERIEIRIDGTCRNCLRLRKS